MSELKPEQQRAVDYLRRRGTDAPIAELQTQLEHAFASTEELFALVPAESRALRPAEGKWSPHEILDHLVLSHEPAIAQLADLLDGISPPGIAIPADLHRDDAAREPWDTLAARLASTHREFLRLAASGTDELSLEPKAVVEVVVKVDGEPLHWYEQVDWKAFVQAVRVHTLEHRGQLERALTR